jgi:16S rRNA (uracil1498-N3)-methyltransferase
MPVFFLPPPAVTPPTVTIMGELLAHLRDSLRIKVGETILVADGDDRRYRAEITAITKQSMTGRITGVIHRPSQRAPSLTLGQALLKGEKMDWVIQKTTELGVQTIIPVQSRQSIVQLKADRVEAQTARWKRIALEAAQQSEQWRAPTIASPRSLSSCMTQIPAPSLTLMLAERRDRISTLASIELPTSGQTSILVLVGPEGGWTREEVSTAEGAGCIPITLGPKMLRAETAAITAIGILQHRLGELG